jgi:hypothetical protein
MPTEYDYLGRPVLTPAQKRAAKRAEKAAYAKGLACYEQLQALLQAGDLAGAVRAINPFQAAEYHTQAIQAVALAQVQAGELLAAVATVQRLRYTDTKGEMIKSIVQVLVQRGDIAGGEWLAATVTGFPYVGVMEVIATAQQRAGNAEAARHALVRAREYAEGFSEGDMKNGYFRSYYLSDIVEAQLRLGDVAGATDTAQLIDRPEDQSRALGLIANANAADTGHKAADPA